MQPLHTYDIVYAGLRERGVVRWVGEEKSQNHNLSKNSCFIIADTNTKSFDEDLFIGPVVLDPFTQTDARHRTL